jgi:hypothetical protein
VFGPLQFKNIKKEYQMTLYKKSILVALMFGATVSATAQLAHAQSAGQPDCNNQKSTSEGCPPVVNPNPPPPAAPVVQPNPPPSANNPVPPAASTSPQKNTANQFNNNQSSGWRYNQNLHHRRHQRDNIFRFSFGGYFYDRPYWQLPQYSYQSNRISCGEGRSIVADNGTTFTYQAHKGSRTYRVYINSRRGTVSGATRLY